MVPIVLALGSTHFAAGAPALFAGFIATTIKGSEYSMLIIARFQSEPVDINYSDPLNPGTLSGGAGIERLWSQFFCPARAQAE